MLIGGFQRFSLSDFPGRSAALVFTQGCNFRCPWCHNASLIPGSPRTENTFSEDLILGFLASRAGMLDGVVITGGEPTLQPDLPDFASRMKSLGYAVKLDTNGSQPRMLSRLLAAGLVDYVAMDVKAPFGRYSVLAGIQTSVEAVAESISLIAGSGVGHEFRTTLVDGMISESDIQAIRSLLPPGSKHRIQKYRNAAAPLYESGPAFLYPAARTPLAGNAAAG
ncbi:MAG: anaerobic ribonucleoside-triphosphate reductase activating protein [Candidatus Krumholzibacteria bacterium]|jgi:pyruvate formate lyase activating enzyme|nr:anaerobic ribonucleoside-triphosphate reductase activating protein [Candidatus Krumholzibacteria bacterium]